MVTQEEIDRINELARKAKTKEGLTKEEEEERHRLRRKYVDSIKDNLKSRLDQYK